MARAEWGATDSSALQTIKNNVEHSGWTLDAIENYVNELPNDMERQYKLLQWLVWGSTVSTSNPNLHALVSSINSYMSTLGENSSTLVEKSTKIAENSDSVITKLDEIIAALEALAESGSSSGGSSGGSGTEITQDWLKETTFTTAYNEEKAATQEYRDWFKSAFGFGGSSSSPSLYNYFDKASYYRVRPVSTDLAWKYNMLDFSYPFAPYQDSQYQYIYTSNWQTAWGEKPNFWSQFSYLLADNLSNVLSNQRNFTLTTQALEYYAHTNLVANLWAIHNTAPTGESPTIGFSDGVLTYKDGSIASGSSAPTTETLDLNPVATNAYESVVGDITTLTEDITAGTHSADNPIDTDAIRARYFAYLDIKGSATDIGDDIREATSSGETLKIDFMGGSAELDLASWGTSYRSIMTQARLQSWRGAMGIIWLLASWVCGFYLVKRLGNME